MKAKANTNNPINPEGATAGHNVATINQTIIDGFKKRLSLENQIDAVKDKYVQPLQDERKELNRTIKADTDIDAKDLDLAFKVWKRQEQAKQFDDEDDRGRILDNMRTVFGALAAGEMLNFMDVMDDGHVNANAKADADEEAEEQADAA